MKENEIKIALRQAIMNGLQLFDIQGVNVEQSYSPRTNGTKVNNTVYFHKLPSHRYGFNKRDDKWNDTDQEMIHTESQWYETTFQINGLTKTDPRDENQITVNDLLQIVSDILSHETTRGFLLSKKIGILRITDITNPFFLDSNDQNESSPSFDVVLTHENKRSTISPVIETCVFGIYRV